MKVTLYHNPRCSKSREALAYLEGENHDLNIIKYLETPPSMSMLASIIDMLGLKDPRDLMRKKEKEYKDLGLDAPDLSKIQLVEAMVAHPKLIERPIAIANGRAAIGRPLDKIKDILTAERAGFIQEPDI